MYKGKGPPPNARRLRLFAKIDIDASSRHTPEGQLENAIGMELILLREWRMKLHGSEVPFVCRLMFKMKKSAADSKKHRRAGEETSRGGPVRKPEVFGVKPAPKASNRQRVKVGGRG